MRDDLDLCGFDDGTGFRCALALGLDAVVELAHGLDSRTYAIDVPSGGMLTLKVTASPAEAALGILMASEQAEGRLDKGFPRIKAVTPLDAAGHDGPLWGILREASDDPDAGPGPHADLRQAELEQAVSNIAYGWRAREEDVILRTVEWWAGRKPVIADAILGLLALREDHGMDVRDIGRGAFGSGPGGDLVVRDFAGVRADPSVVARLLDRAPAPVPVPLPPAP